jgi:hypothetical protein
MVGSVATEKIFRAVLESVWIMAILSGKAGRDALRNSLRFWTEREPLRKVWSPFSVDYRHGAARSF